MHLAVATLIVVVDQLTKLALFDQATLNQGIAFGIGKSFGPLLPLLVLFGMFCLVGLFRRTRHPVGSVAYWSWPLIVGGLTSNLIDRMRIGSVIDPFSLPILNIHCNIADIAIVVGCTLLGYAIITEKRR